MRTWTFTIVITLLTGLTAGCARGGPAQAPATGSFVATIGAGPSLDTVAVERYTLWADSLTGESVVAYPRAMKRTYTASLGPNGRIRHIRIVTSPAGGDTAGGAAAPVTTMDFTYGADSVTVDARRDTLSRHYAVATNGEEPLPFYEDLFVFWERAVGRAMAGSADSTTFGMLAGHQVLPIWFKRLSPTTADFGFPDWGTVRAELNADHQFLALDMDATTNKYLVQRVPDVDVETVADTWGARPQPGQLSPRDTARAEIAGASIIVDYGRPAMRGREVFGGIVPWGQVWRTGANAATQLITDHDLVIGGTTVPAGTYSLFSLPAEDGWTLIINKQHGQWGTQYDPAQDFARIPLTVTHPDEPVERFTITVSPTGARTGELAFEWAQTKGAVAFQVK